MSECMQQRNVNETMERAWLEGANPARKCSKLFGEIFLCTAGLGGGGRSSWKMQTNRDIVMQHANYLNIYELPAKPSQAGLS